MGFRIMQQLRLHSSHVFILQQLAVTLLFTLHCEKYELKINDLSLISQMTMRNNIKKIYPRKYDTVYLNGVA